MAAVLVMAAGATLGAVVAGLASVLLIALAIIRWTRFRGPKVGRWSGLAGGATAFAMVGAPFVLRDDGGRLSLLDNDNLSAISLAQHFSGSDAYNSSWDTDFGVKVMPRLFGAFEGRIVGLLSSLVQGDEARARLLLDVHSVAVVLAACACGTALGTLFARWVRISHQERSGHPIVLTAGSVALLVAASFLGPLGLEFIFGASHFFVALALVAYGFSISDGEPQRPWQLGVCAFGVVLLWPLLLPVLLGGTLGLHALRRTLRPPDIPQGGLIANGLGILAGAVVSLPWSAPNYLQRSLSSFTNGAATESPWSVGGTVSLLILAPMAVSVLAAILGFLSWRIVAGLSIFAALIALWPVVQLLGPKIAGMVNDGYYVGRTSYAVAILLAFVITGVVTSQLLEHVRREGSGIAASLFAAALVAAAFGIGTLYYPSVPPYWHTSETSLQAFPSFDELLDRFDPAFSPFFDGAAVLASVGESLGDDEVVLPWTQDCRKTGAVYYAALWRLALRFELSSQAAELGWANLGECQTPGWFRLAVPSSTKFKFSY